jgi:Phage integrase, N-terminal/Integrase
MIPVTDRFRVQRTPRQALGQWPSMLSATVRSSMPNESAVQRWQETSPCTKREWCVPLSLVVLDRPCAIEADNNTDQTAAHTESLVPASGRKQEKDQQHEEWMRDLNYQLKQLCHRNRDGSYATQADRAGILQLVANQLHEAGFRDLHATGLKPKHVEALCQRWQAEALSAGTIKNRMAALRWWAEKIGKRSVIARDNADYGIANRQLVSTDNKARALTDTELSRIDDPYTRLSLRLQAAFGLRRAESIKIQPTWADRGNALVLRASWCKGGRERSIPIRTEPQRLLLDEAKSFAGRGSLIPLHSRYLDQLRRFEHQCSQAGIHNVHGHRHAYAQARYKELTGWNAPAAGGPSSRSLSPEQKTLDREARLTISAELGHEREQVTTIYLSR